MENVEFETYKRPNGHDEFLEWLNALPDRDQQKMLMTIEQTQEQGLMVARQLKWIKKLDNNLFELRSETGGNIQRAIYFHVEHGQYIITHGFTKKTQKTPAREIKHAIELRKEWSDNEN
ncbi:hypothetical protein WKK_03615 [Weissella koreensis KACC 15510]|uniref:type II toxin-antitoxin system RelE/ParE family toxin n=1 Tax=Weissella koreensis TaxID=165096 RepID=UPI0002175A67|nr:type II toxin-antitoxin system RelE/ParE family toxin [Weissella koreensis]AEJ23597.1 hypothetical protein WKK_03615 [Weissella koreensis KACC 15510]